MILNRILRSGPITISKRLWNVPQRMFLIYICDRETARCNINFIVEKKFNFKQTKKPRIRRLFFFLLLLWMFCFGRFRVSSSRSWVECDVTILETAIRFVSEKKIQGESPPIQENPRKNPPASQMSQHSLNAWPRVMPNAIIIKRISNHGNWLENNP